MNNKSLTKKDRFIWTLGFFVYGMVVSMAATIIRHESAPVISPYVIESALFVVISGASLAIPWAFISIFRKNRSERQNYIAWAIGMFLFSITFFL